MQGVGEGPYHGITVCVTMWHLKISTCKQGYIPVNRMKRVQVPVLLCSADLQLFSFEFEMAQRLLLNRNCGKVQKMNSSGRKRWGG